MIRKNALQNIICLASVFFCAVLSYAENIDPDNDGSQYAYGENVSWLNFEPNVPGDPCEYGVTVSDTGLTGFVWAENIGWINLTCENTSSCGTLTMVLSMMVMVTCQALHGVRTLAG